MLAGHSSIRVTFDICGHLFRLDAEDQTALAEIEARLLRLSRHWCSTIASTY
jgi:hypothetical protein